MNELWLTEKLTAAFERRFERTLADNPAQIPNSAGGRTNSANHANHATNNATGAAAADDVSGAGVGHENGGGGPGTAGGGNPATTSDHTTSAVARDKHKERAALEAEKVPPNDDEMSEPLGARVSPAANRAALTEVS